VTEGGRGFSIVEVVLAMSVVLLVTAGVFSVLNPAQGSFSTQSEVADIEQRLRVASDTLYRDLVMAGAGAYIGTQTGPLTSYFAPILPSRQGAVNDDPPATFRRDTVTLFHVPTTSAQTTISQVIAGTSPELRVHLSPGCPRGQTLCGFAAGMTVVVFDVSGQVGLFRVTDVHGSSASLRANRAGNDSTFPEGAKIAQISSRTYSLKKATSQLVQYDGTTNADVPVVDHVVGLTFDYYGDPQPPRRTGRSLDDPTGPWTTYGPAPPAVTAQIPGRGYPAGENCTFVAVRETHAPRLPVLGGSGTATLVKLTEAQLTDGPWCPDGANVNRFDADLYRVRKLEVTMRVESANAALRGPAGALFRHSGTSSGGGAWLPDQQRTFQVTPRNLNLSR
jgi:Tfp pilus assembly protein PilW